MNPKAMAYRRLDTEARVHAASPEQLITLMFDGALARLREARVHIEADRIDKRSAAINKAIAIIGGLQSSLDVQKGGEIATNLEALYDYMQRRLFRANIDSDIEGIDEVANLLGNIRGAWDIVTRQRAAAPVREPAPHA